MRKGIDVSHHQGVIDFNKVKGSGIDFVILREGFGTVIDKRFLEYARNAIKAGLKILGVYHFSYAISAGDANEEASSCIRNLEAAGLPKDTLVFYDFEYDTVDNAKTRGVKLGPKECNEFTSAFCSKVVELGYKPGVYTNLDYYRNWYHPSTFSNYPIWFAYYSGKPEVECLIHQYSNKGSVSGINTDVDMNYYYGEDFKMDEKKTYLRNEVVKLATSWLGKNVADGSYKEIIDIYNTLTNPPRGTKMRYDWAWCACTWSALAIKLGYTEIMPIEISCGQLINSAKKMGIWHEDDAYIPKPGDAILYDWDDNGVGDDVGWPDHIGTVTYVNVDSGYMEVIEGNCDNRVKKRSISINGRYIRGYIAPKYDSDKSYDPEKENKFYKDVAREVIIGKWGTGDSRKKLLADSGYDYDIVQSMVNEILNGSAVTATSPSQELNQTIKSEIVASCVARNFSNSVSGVYVTTADMYLRNDAGVNKKAICVIPNDTEVKCYGYYNTSNGTRWLYIQFVMDHVKYTGFCSSVYLKKVRKA